MGIPRPCLYPVATYVPYHNHNHMGLVFGEVVFLSLPVDSISSILEDFFSRLEEFFLEVFNSIIKG